MNIRPVLIISLRNYYDSFQFIVNNGNQYSTLIPTSYGVKQGGNISPDLYKLYTEQIAIDMDQAKLGIKIGKLLINVLMYADDVIILADNIVQAQKMLDIITKFGEDYQIKYNPDKTNIMIESTKKETRKAKLLLCGKEIVKTEHIKYLGSDIACNGKSRSHLEIRKSKTLSSLNSLRTNDILNDHLSIDNRIKLYNIYIKPLMYYGIESTLINKGDLDLLERAEGNNLKTTIGIPYKCISEPIYGALKIPKTTESIKLHRYKFIIRALENTYFNEFFKEMLCFQTKNSIIGNLRKDLGIRSSNTISQIIKKIESEITDIYVRVNDRYVYNEKAQIIRQILNTENNELRRLRLTRELYYNKNNR